MTAVAVSYDDLPVAPPRLDSAAVEQARLVRLARDHIASHEPSVDYDGLARGRDSTVLAARQWVKRQRGRGRLFVVDHGGTTLIPSFQLDEVFDVDERGAAVVERLTTGGLHGWAQWQWFTAVNPWIDARPVDRLHDGEAGLAEVLRGSTASSMPETGAPCGLAGCPIVEPTSIDRRSLRTHVLPAGTEWYRVARAAHGDEPFTPSGVGDGRFSPLGGRGHCYLAAQRSASLLESALHEAAGPNPRIYAAQLHPFRLYRLRLRVDVRLVDLRDAALDALGVGRAGLTGADARHYACTRAVAERLVGAKDTVGLVWTSRQGHLHAERNPDGLASEVLRHEQLDVAVVYAPDADGALEVLDAGPLVAGGAPIRFVRELANLLRIAIL